MIVSDTRDLPLTTTAGTAPPWYTAAAASSDPAGRLAQAGARTDAQVLAEAAKIIVSRLPGLSSLPRPEREWLMRSTVGMLTWAHRQAAPRSAESWLASIIPGVATQGLPTALSAAATSAINRAQDILTTVVSEPAEDLPVLLGSPNLSILGDYPTPEQLEELERFGEKVVETAKGITKWADIDCTPDLSVIIMRLRIAEKVALASAPPMSPPFRSITSNSRIGVEVHRLVTEQYVKDHTDSLIVADRVVYAEGKRVGTLSAILSGRNKLPKAYDNGYTMQQLRFLDHSLRGGQKIFKRADITDLTEKTVYEVKPRLGASGAVVQLWEYLAGYNMSAQFIPDDQSVRREQRKAYPYAPGQECKNPHVIAEGTWKPAPETFVLSSRPGAIAVVFTEPELPGLLLYDVYAPQTEDEESDALRAFLDLIRVIIGREILRRNFPGPEPPQPPPPGNGKLPEEVPEEEEEEPERPPWRPPEIDWDSPSAQVLKWVLIIAMLVLLGYLLWPLIVAAVAAAGAAVAAIIFVLLAAFAT
jgi:hypothetical protein